MSAAAPPPAEHWAAVRALFDEAVALPPAERGAWLARSAASPAVQDEVRSLLEHAGEAGGFLEAPAAAPPRAPLPTGLRLGAWAVVGPLGEGGMGEVYEARRADGSYEARAAVKVLRGGLDSAAVLQRFAQEQRALARLNHPHIARLLDAGRTPDARPYFVMEVVQGAPIDRACEGLPVAARLQLFLQLADAVAHAHRQLLLHRDLKPGNVLVTPDGQVKLLDFGIAKALDPLEAGDGDATLAGERPFTPHYASPEQIRGEPVGTATDIYSLGVLLYVMLTGVRPYGRAAASAAEAARSVLEELPRRPSTVMNPQAGREPAAPLRRRLAGDLDNIVLKALKKAPEERYASVDAFAADVRAHLEGRPVSARAPSWLYIAGRFVRRNRVAAAAAALAVVALVGGSAVALWQARVADAQRAAAQARFKQVRQLANQLVFKYHDQVENLPGATKVREALLTDAAEFLDNLSQSADDDPGLAEELAGTYYRISRLQGVDQSINLGQHRQAEANLDKAIALTQRYVGRQTTSIEALTVAVNMRVSKAELWQRRGHMAEAEATLHEALTLLERALGRAPNDAWALAGAISLHGVRARILGSQLAHASLGRWGEAAESADRARAAAEASIVADPANNYGPDSLAFTLGEQAHSRYLAGRLDDARALFERQVALRDQMAAKFADDMDFRWQRAVARAGLARVLLAQGQPAAAQVQLAEALAIGQAAAAADPANRGGRERLQALAVQQLEWQVSTGELAAARSAADALLAAWPASEGQLFADVRLRAEALVWSARAWQAAQPQRALALAEQAAALMPPARAADDNASRRWLLAQAQGEAARALAAQGQAEAARQRAAAALQVWQAPAPGGGALPPPVPLRPWLTQAQRLAQGGR